jgi:phage tail sheath gpL-like
MTVPFVNTPSNLRIPLFFAELDASKANTAGAAQRTLLIGQITSAGTYTAGTPVRISSAAEAITGGGVGSILSQMAAYYALNDRSGEVWALPLADAGGAVAATGTIAITGPATASGTIALYIAGVKVSIPVTAGDAASAIAANIAAAINASDGRVAGNTNMIGCGLPVTASAASANVTVTARNAGLLGNDIDLRLNHLGSAGGEFLPAGVGITITAMASGATNPTITTALGNLADQAFDTIVCAQTDATALSALKSFLADTAGGRWNPMSQIYGHAWTALRATAGTAATFATGQNNQHLTTVPFYDSPSPCWAWAAGFAGQGAASLRADPGVPLQFLTVVGLLAPLLASRYQQTVRNSTLLYSGCSTWTADTSGNVVIERIITTYVTNAQGAPDNSYLNVETLYTLMYVIRFMRSWVQAKYSRVKLAADGTRVRPNSNVVTPAIIRADVIAAYRTLEEDYALVQQSDLFAQNLIVEKDATNPDRVNILWPGTLINQLRQFATLFQFRLI